MIEVERALIKSSKYGRSVMIPPTWLQHLKIQGHEVKKIKLKIYDDRIEMYPIFQD